MDNTIDTRYMSRAIELARHGLGYVSPNPMVGAVIVHDGRIIGEGYHRMYGGAHAEVNAVNSVQDKSLLRSSTIYVTLEPCSHYGKTPPCAGLLIECGIPRVVIGIEDPFAKVSGRGIAMLREAGTEVSVGVLEEECRRLNRVFIAAHTLKRPFMTLKWAQSADGYMDVKRGGDTRPFRFSNPETTMLTHRLRSLNDAVITTAMTVNADNPQLTVRDWHGREPLKVIIDRSNNCRADAGLRQNSDTIILHDNLSEAMSALYGQGITSCLVEAGPQFLTSCIDAGYCDCAVVETSPVHLGSRGARPAPAPPGIPKSVRNCGGNLRIIYETA